jgi:hypothetical protein
MQLGIWEPHNRLIAIYFKLALLIILEGSKGGPQGQNEIISAKKPSV